MTISEVETGVRTAIWLTYKCRMSAERRLQRYDLAAHLLLSWLSLSVIAWSVARGSISDKYLDLYTAIVSTFVFAFSVIIFGFRFSQSAAKHRECYLKLQKLYDEENLEGLDERYHDILGNYENHSNWDYEDLIIEEVFFNKRILTNKSGGVISVSRLILFKYFFRRIVFLLIAGSLFYMGLRVFWVCLK